MSPPKFSGTKNFTHVKNKNGKPRKPQVKYKSMKTDKHTL